MESLEEIVQKMESQIDRADSKLDHLAVKLDQFESRVLLSDGSEVLASSAKKISNRPHPEGEESNSEKGKEINDDCLDPKLLSEVLVEVKRVKDEYNQLAEHLHQVQELQLEVTRSLRQKMKQVQNHFDQLRERVISGGGSLPAPKNS